MDSSDPFPSSPRVLIVSGLAGAGKSVALRALEDVGFHCIDNLPAQLLSTFAAQLTQSVYRWQHIAVALDSRDSDVVPAFVSVFPQLEHSCQAQILFLEATEDVVIKRFRETRRLHPLVISEENAEGETFPLAEAIRRDIDLLTPIRAQAFRVIDTSAMTAQYLRQLVRHAFAPSRDSVELRLHIVSFGFKYGVPSDVDLVFDVRCFANPHYVDHLRPLTGLNAAVRDYVFADPNVDAFVERVRDLIAFLFPLYENEGKSYLGIGIGCTGGKHRSVAIAEQLAAVLEPAAPSVRVEHRHFDRE